MATIILAESEEGRLEVLERMLTIASSTAWPAISSQTKVPGLRSTSSVRRAVPCACAALDEDYITVPIADMDTFAKGLNPDT